MDEAAFILLYSVLNYCLFFLLFDIDEQRNYFPHTTIHIVDFRNYGMLMLGRLLGGISTSLLFSVFEAWLIKAHSDADLPKQCLPKSFSWAAFGNGAVAILAGLIANHIAHSAPMTQVSGNIYKGGYLNPFDLAIGALILCGGGAFMLWEENYGSQEDESNNNETQDHDKAKAAWYDGLRNALHTTLRRR